MPLWLAFLTLLKARIMLSDAIHDNIDPLRDACDHYLDSDDWLDFYPGDSNHRIVTRHCLVMLESVRQDLDTCGGNPHLEGQLWLVATAVVLQLRIRRWLSLSCWISWIRRGFSIRSKQDLEIWLLW